MNSFKIYFKNGDTETEEKGVVFPFRYGELLDERLDEAYVDIIGSTVEAYRPTTEVRVEINNNDTIYNQYYIVANDSSVEYPIGSGKYKHSIYLIERTKLLEGIVCSSLTFTNALSRDFTTSFASFTYKDGNLAYDLLDILYTTRLDIPAYFPLKETYTPPSAGTVANKIGESFRKAWGPGPYSMTFHTCTMTVKNGNTEETFEAPNAPTLEVEPGLTLSYTIKWTHTAQDSGSVERYVTIEFSPTVFEIYMTPKRWTITDCVNRVLECAIPLFKGENPKYRFDGVEYKDGKIDGEYTGQALKYEKVLAPEFTMTQCTLREQLKVIGNFIHAEPYLDEDDVVKFIPFNTNEQALLSNLSNPYISASSKYNINQYCTEIRSTGTTITTSLGYAKGLSFSPSQKRYLSLRSEEIFTRITEKNGIILTDYPIYSIEKVECGLYDSEDEDKDSPWDLYPHDITKFVFEATEYNSNLSSYAGRFPYSKNHALYYTIGDNHIKGLFYKAPHSKSSAKYSPYAISNILYEAGLKDAIDQSKPNDRAYADAGDVEKAILGKEACLCFRITYTAMCTVDLSHGKPFYDNAERYTVPYNPSENLSETSFLGENLKGVVARLGNVEKEKTYVICSLENVPRAGQTIDDLIISAVYVELMPNIIKCTVALTKFNRISEFVGISSNKRLYEISERNVYNRNILINENIVVGEHQEDSTTALVFKNYEMLKSIFMNLENERLDVAICRGCSKTDKNDEFNKVCLPLLTLLTGNVLSLSFKFKDNYSAGCKSEYIEGADDITGYWLQDVRYTDYYGKLYWLDFYFDSSAKDDQLNSAFSLPEHTSENQELSEDAPKLRLRKDSREHVSISYELEAKSNLDTLTVGTAFMQHSGFVCEHYTRFEMYIFKSRYTGNRLEQSFTLPKEYEYIAADSLGFDISDFENSKGFNIKPFEFYFEPGADEVSKQHLCNNGYGWAIVCPSSAIGYQVMDEDGNKMTQYENEDKKIVLLSTAQDTKPISIDIFATRN